MVNVNFMNPFVEAAVEVLKAEVQLVPQRGSLSLTKSALTTNDITVLISLVGQVQGVVMYGMSIDTGLELVSRMMGQVFKEFDNLAQSGVAEMGNVITGRATVKLYEGGFSAMISPPTLIQGRDVTISTLDFARIIVPLVTEAGEIVIHLALRESPTGQQDNNFVDLTIPPSSTKS